MGDIVILDHARHGDVRVRRGASDPHRFVRVALQEFPLLADRSPLFFAKDASTGAFFCGAMRGIDEGEDLLAADEGASPDLYRPLELQRAPFSAAGSGLAADLKSPMLAWDGGDGEALFVADGSPTEYAVSVRNAIEALRGGLEAARLFVERLLADRLIEPIDISLSFDDGTTRSLEGLYTIDHDRLRALPPEAVVELFGRGYIQLAYLMIWSLRQVPRLAQRKNRQLSEPAAAGSHG